MAFPRSFRAQTWFLKLPDGQIEVATASDLERSFRCGLIGPHTRVRATGSPVWATLADVAELEHGSSLAPVAMSEAEPDDGARWRAGKFNDERSHRAPTRAPFVLAFAAAAAMLFGASPKWEGAWPSAGASATRASMRAAARAPSPKRKIGAADATALAETPRRAKGPSKEVSRRLHELDVVRRMYEIASRRSRIRAPKAETRRIGDDPFLRNSAPGDPLDGAL